MKISWLSKLLLLAVMTVSLSGCIVIPAWDIDDRGHHRGGYHDKHHGDHHGGHRGGDHD